MSSYDYRECCVEFRGDDNWYVRAEIMHKYDAPMMDASVTLCDRRISGYRIGHQMSSLNGLAADDISHVMADMPAQQGFVITKDEAERIGLLVAAAITKLLK